MDVYLIHVRNAVVKLDGLIKMKKETMWFGCKKCLYRPEKDNDKSSENWNVFTCAPCPHCGEQMRMHFENFLVNKSNN